MESNGTSSRCAPLRLTWAEVVEAFDKLPPRDRRRAIGALLAERLSLTRLARWLRAALLAAAGAAAGGFAVWHLLTSR